MRRPYCVASGLAVGLFLVYFGYQYQVHQELDHNSCTQTKTVVTVVERDGCFNASSENDASKYCDRHNFRRPNQLITEYDTDVAHRLAELVERKAPARDPELIQLVLDVLDPPSPHMVKMSKQLLETPQSKEVNTLLNNKKNGFFIECGGFDGERSSNTLYLEQVQHWTGLLVEMDPYFYTQLIGKSRRAWSINACLSPVSYVTMMPYVESSGGAGELSRTGSVENPKSGQKVVPCFPLETLLVALKQETIDYFSLDVEGFELDILRTIPFDEFDISILSVEYVHGRAGKSTYSQFMNSKGYRVHKDIHLHNFDIALFVDDFIFVKDLTQIQLQSQPSGL